MIKVYRFRGVHFVGMGQIASFPHQSVHISGPSFKILYTPSPTVNKWDRLTFGYFPLLAAELDSGVRSAKSTLLEAVNNQFRRIFSQSQYYLATILVPRYKDCFFDTMTKQEAKNMLIQNHHRDSWHQRTTREEDVYRKWGKWTVTAWHV